MIASIIGKTLLAEYNRRSETKYSAEEFFEKVFHPLFYDHKKYMQWVTNSPFVQGYKKATPPNKIDRAARLNTLKEKAHSGSEPDASFAIGFAASGVLGTTSGQVSNLLVPLDPDDVFASWIGSGLGIGVQGGFSIYFNHPEILWKVYEGWPLYRRFLQQHENLRSNQIDTWNGRWFAHASSDDFIPDYPEIGMEEALTPSKEGGMELKTQQWTEVLFSVASRFKERQVLGYVFSLGQMNTTIGFIPFELPEVKRPLQFYEAIFGENAFLADTKKITKLYGTAHSFRSACRNGSIGVLAMEPKDLAQYMTSAKGPGKRPDFEKADSEKKISFNVYQTWLMAMLNNKELWDRANDAALAYLEYVAGDKKASTLRANNVAKTLDASNKRQFIEACSELVQNGAASSQKISDLVEEVNSLPEDNFRYFQTLVKFRYYFHKNQQQGEVQ
jgi:hypothetical protein